MRLATAAFLLAAIGASPAQAAGIALVLAIDVSESVSSERYLLQHEGIARAFETPRLVDIIAAMPGGMEALVLEWSDPDKIAITVGWTRIASHNGAAAFAAAVRGTTRTSNGLAILSEEPWLDDYYRQNVIGGPSSFVAVAKTFDNFADAMLRKLVQEVARGPLVNDAE